MVANLSGGKTVSEATIAAINSEIQIQSGSIEIRKTENGFEKSFRADFRKPCQLLAPVAESAADLLCYGVPARIKKCENPNAFYIFTTRRKIIRAAGVRWQYAVSATKPPRSTGADKLREDNRRRQKPERFVMRKAR